MAFPLGAVLGGVNTGLGIIGALGAKAKQRRLQEAMDFQIRQAYERYNNATGLMRTSLADRLSQTAGYGGDLIRNTATNVQSGLANAGIQSGSLAAAGTLAAQRNVNEALAGQQAQNLGILGARDDEFNRFYTGLHMGNIGRQQDYADQEYAGSVQSLMGGLQKLAQFNLSRTAPNKPGLPGPGMNNSSIPAIQTPGPGSALDRAQAPRIAKRGPTRLNILSRPAFA